MGLDIDIVIFLRMDILLVIIEIYGFWMSVDVVFLEVELWFDIGNFEQLVKFKFEVEIEVLDWYVINVVEYLLCVVFDYCVSDIYIELKCEYLLVWM